MNKFWLAHQRVGRIKTTKRMIIKTPSLIGRSVLSTLLLVITCLFAFSDGIAASTGPLSVQVTMREASTPSERCVVLLHGLARTSGSMNKLSNALNEAGWSTANVDYPSREHPIAVLAPAAVGQGVAACRSLGATKIDAVTHSLGGILMRHYLNQESIEEFNRLVMLGPPNHGSEVVDNLGDVPGFAAFNGPAGLELGTEASSVPNTLGPIPVDVGIVAGTTSINLVLSNFLPNPDDGKVSATSARLEGMCAMILIPVAHPFLMTDDAAIANVLEYLTHGKFLSNNENTPEYPACDHR